MTALPFNITLRYFLEIDYIRASGPDSKQSSLPMNFGSKRPPMPTYKETVKYPCQSSLKISLIT